MSRRCGRIDDHPAHDWTRCSHLDNGWSGPVRRIAARTYRCDGAPVIEGGHRGRL